MSTDAQDIAIAGQLRQAGIATPDQIAKGLATQGQALEKGARISLAEALVQAGVITPAQRESLEKQARRQQGRVQELGSYRLKKKLGEGGMGAVYLAEDSRNGRRVALKVLPRNHAADPEFMKRFKREIEAAIKLEHPNIVRAYESGEDLGYNFYTMEFCEGESLEAALKRQGLLSWQRAFRIVRDVAQGLGYAHKIGFVHRDIKPANVILAVGGQARILDLGLAKKIDEAQLSFKTATGTVLGTPHYISPEQARGEKQVDGRADIYSLGATLYQLVTGEVPFTGNSLYEILEKHVNAELPNPQDLAEDIPDGVVLVLRRMMAKDPRNRYPDCSSLDRDVDLILQGKSPETALVNPGESSVAALRQPKIEARRKRAGTYRMPKTEVPRARGKVLLWSASATVIAIMALVALYSGSTPSSRESNTPISSGKRIASIPALTETRENEETVAKMFSVPAVGGQGGGPASLSGLVGQWLFDEGKGTAVMDSSGKGNDGRLNGGVKWAAGVSGNALEFEGIPGYVSLGVSGLPGPAAPQTIAWVQRIPSQSTNPTTLIALSDDPTSVNLTLGYRDGKIMAWKYGGVPLVSTPPPLTDEWHCYAYSFDGELHKLFVNGYLKGSSRVSQTQGSYKRLELGRWWGGSSAVPPGQYFQGTVDDVRIYSRALGEEEIRSLVRKAGTALPSQPGSRLLLDDFAQGTDGWSFHDGKEFPGARGALFHDRAAGHNKAGSLRLSADFTGGGSYISGGRILPTRSDLKGVRFWLRGDGVVTVGLRVEDGSGQIHQKPISLAATREWQEVTVIFDKWAGGDHWGGANDGKWHGPVKSLHFCPHVASFAAAKSGEIWIDDLEGILFTDEKK